MKSEKWLLLTMIGLAGLVYSIISEDKAEDEVEDEVEDEDEDEDEAEAEAEVKDEVEAEDEVELTESAHAETGI
jgi:hypothetical protein